MSTGDRYCYSCFDKREDQASKIYHEDFMDRNWGLYFIPIIGGAIALGKAIKYPDGTRYHVYIDGYHERWSRHERDKDDLQKCKKCGEFCSTYYELESWE